MVWQYVAVFVISLYLYTQIPKPKSQARPGIESIKAPTADSSRDLPVIFGTVDIRGPHVGYYGDLRTEAIRERAGGK